MQRWLSANQIKTLYIDRGSLWQNGFVESFHSRFRDECLNRETLWTLTESRVVAEDYRCFNNHQRPHSKLGYLSLARFAANQIQQQTDPSLTPVGLRPPYVSVPLIMGYSPLLLLELEEQDALSSGTKSFGSIARLFASYRINYVYVVSPEKRFLGVVSLHEMKPHLNDPVLSETVVALDIMREDFPVLTPNQDLTEALRAFSKHDGERIPVVNDTTERRLIGIISKTDLLLSLAEISAAP